MRKAIKFGKVSELPAHYESILSVFLSTGIFKYKNKYLEQ